MSMQRQALSVFLENKHLERKNVFKFYLGFSFVHESFACFSNITFMSSAV